MLELAVVPHPSHVSPFTGAGLGSPFVFPGVHEEGRRLFCIPGNLPHCLCEQLLPMCCACSRPSGNGLILPSVGPRCKWDIHHSSVQLMEIWTLFSSPMLSLTHSWRFTSVKPFKEADRSLLLNILEVFSWASQILEAFYASFLQLCVTQITARWK